MLHWFICRVLNQHDPWCRGRIDHTVTRDGRTVRVRNVKRTVPTPWSNEHHNVGADMQAAINDIWEQGRENPYG